MATQRQIDANRANRKLWRGHTPEGLERLRKAVRRREPWLQSTGPTTALGKAISKMNALRHGGRSARTLASSKMLNRLLRQIRQLVDNP